MDDDIRNSDNRNDSGVNGNSGDYKPRSGAPENIEQMHSIKLENISPRTTKESLTAEFQVFGDIGDVYVPMKMGTMIPRGFAFVRFLNRDDMEAALQSMDGKIIDGSEVKIVEAEQRPKYDAQLSLERRRQFMRGGRGGFGGGGGYRRDDYRRDDYRDRGYDRGYSRGGYDDYDQRGGYSRGRGDYRDDYRRDEYRGGGGHDDYRGRGRGGHGDYDRRERDRSRSR